MVDFWHTKYDWRRREAFLNSLPQFKTKVAGLDIHFIHAVPAKVPAGTKVLPLLLLHGWPGSVRALYSLIPLLTAPRAGYDFVFEVRIASTEPWFGAAPVLPLRQQADRQTAGCTGSRSWRPRCPGSAFLTPPCDRGSGRRRSASS